ncbi:sulfatase [Brevibacillus sp. B_LB10_24]|uniref:sulfatase family protein n=1 Tax=Brevibacillus sp. B_LB10_24 TaxID=3380645 RepID=UPI0038B9D895
MANSQQTSNGNEKPNVILFMVDQLAAKWLEAASSGTSHTPNICRLQQRGVTFTNAFTSNPVCSPSRSTIATGLTSRGHGLIENGYYLDPSIPTFMQVLQENGWRTGGIGKMHFQPLSQSRYPDYRAYGFDVTHVTEDCRSGEWLDWVEQEHPEYYEKALATVWACDDMPVFAEYGPNRVNLREKIKQIREGFEWSTPEFPNNTRDAYTLPFPEEISQSSWITKNTLSFIREMSRSNQPFFAQVSYVGPHYPYAPPAEYMNYVDVDKIPAPVPAEWAMDPHAPHYFKEKEPVTGDWRHVRHCYFADISYLDYQIGLVMDALEETGQLANTYIIFVSDHGDLLYDHGLLNKEEKHYDACIRVPLIIAGPQVQAGKVCDELVQLEDICPTILEMASLPAPSLPSGYNNISESDIQSLPGSSLLGWCRGEKPSAWRDAAYIESYNSIWNISPNSWARTIRTKEFRYTFYPNGNGEQMFHLGKDVNEQNNIVSNPEFADVRQKLRDRLMDLIVLQDYPKTPRNLVKLGVY